MKKFLSYALLALLLSGCSSEDESEDSSLLDMYEDVGGEEEGETPADAGVEEEPYSVGPMEIPDDLVLPE